jgi:hypothetical protein
MKFILSILILFISFSALASTVEANLVYQNGWVQLKNNKVEIRLTNVNGFFNPINEENVLYANFYFLNKLYPIAEFSSENEGDSLSKRVSINKVRINIIKNVKEREFKVLACSNFYMGCFPYPHFETINRELIEVQTIDGNTLCYNNNVIEDFDLWTIGSCPLINTLQK